MIVEDDSFMLQLYGHLFHLEGFEIESASDGKDALDKLKADQNIPDVIMLDIMMPGMSGFEFLEHKNKDEKLKDVPVIVLSNVFTEAEKQKAKDLGAKEFVVKSEQDPKDLVKKVKAILPQKA